MGEAPEAPNDVAVLRGVVGAFLEVAADWHRSIESKCRARGDTALLSLDILGVLQREIEEKSLDGLHQRVRSIPHRFQCQAERQGIGGKGSPGTAKRITGELIHEQDQCQSAARCVRPICEMSRRGSFHIGIKLVFDLSVDGAGLAAFSTKPEIHSTSQRLGALECICEPEAPEVLDPRVNWIGFFGHGSATLTLWTEPLNRRMRILAHACTPVLPVSA
jgi:hypothetical protein